MSWAFSVEIIIKQSKGARQGDYDDNDNDENGDDDDCGESSGGDNDGTRLVVNVRLILICRSYLISIISYHTNK